MATLPAGLEERDLVGLAPTGTGKTLAYTIPLAQRLLDHPPPRVKGRPVDPAKRLRALVLCPVRELAQQVAEEARTLFKGSVLRSKAVYGKSALRPQREAIESGVDLLVGTPGRLRELIDCGALSLAHVRQVVVDEADRMLDMGFLPQVRFILDRIPDERQMMFFSATMPDPISSLAADFLRLPFRAEIEANTVVSHVGQYAMHLPDLVKVPVVLELIKGQQRRGVIVFARTRRRAGWVATALRRNDLSVGLVHGNRSQAQRQSAIERFTSGELAVLVATDVAARGLHIPAIKTVINYDLPVTTEEYVHRVGRAGHGGGAGEAFSLVTPQEEGYWKRFRSVSGTRVEIVDPPDYQSWMRPVDL
ncbi:MAG: DEAD/DEAH box helicase, partial [Planctomycetota bacterium]|nr:DEAD/DEAH box helicase [Planctomycetota bacterium]